MAKLLFAGSGEFTDSMNDIDSYLCSSINLTKIMIIPTAAGKEKDFHKWIDNGISHFKKIGKEAFGGDLISREDYFKDEYIALLDKTNFIYFSGGDPEYLLSCIENTPFLEKLLSKLKEKDFILAGSSAGAMIMGSYTPVNILNRIFSSNKKGVFIREALDLGHFIVIPHFNKIPKILELKYISERIINSLPDITIVGIDEDTAILTENNTEFKVLGKGSVYIINGNAKIISYKNYEIFNIK